MANRYDAFWPTIIDVPSAKRAVDAASTAAFFVALATSLIGSYALVTGRSVLGLDGYSLVDAGLMLVVGWRVREFSKPWAIVGVVYWVFNMALKLVRSGPTSASGVISLFVLLGLIGGVRGAFAFEKFSRPPKPHDTRLSTDPPLSDREAAEVRETYARLSTSRLKELLADRRGLRPGAEALLIAELALRPHDEVEVG